MKRLIFSSLGLFTILGLICSPSRESSPSKRIVVAGSAQAASSSAVAANQGEYDATINWRDLVILRNKSLKNLFNDFKQALIDGRLKQAEFIFDIMNIYKRSKKEAIELIKLVRPDFDLSNFDEYDTLRLLRFVQEDLSALMGHLKLDQADEAIDLIKLANLDIKYLMESLDPSSVANTYNLYEDDDTILAREIRNFDILLDSKDFISADFYYNLIKRLESKSKSNKLKRLAADILSRAGLIMQKQ